MDNLKIAKTLIRIARGLVAENYLSDEDIASQFSKWWIDEIEVNVRERGGYDVDAHIVFPNADHPDFDTGRSLWFIVPEREMSSIGDSDALEGVFRHMGDVNDIWMPYKEMQDLYASLAGAVSKMDVPGKRTFSSAEEFRSFSGLQG